MNSCSQVFRVGTRPSKLASIQTYSVMERFKEWLPGIRFEVHIFSSPGDRDRETDLRISPDDFFTRDLDQAVLSTQIDLAVHSAKDLPDPVPEGLDWCWLPWPEDPRDALVLRPGCGVAELSENAVIGVSSERREEYCHKRFPKAQRKSVRGNIEERLAQLDRGDYDMLMMAGAALIRLNLQHRVTEWISVEELPPPDGQGYLAMTFRAHHDVMRSVRNLFLKAVRFVGAGVGSMEHCTLAGIKAIQQAEVCLYDALMDSHLLEWLPPNAQRIDVGKRCGDHTLPQEETTRLIANYARRGRRVVRLKGGDPGILARLAEELEWLDRLEIPYQIVPGVSSLNAATTGTGMLLTRRGVSRGFTVMTPRGEGGTWAPIDAQVRASLPIVLFMATKVLKTVVQSLIQEGLAAETPAAVVFDAGSDQERMIRAPLAQLCDAVGELSGTAAGLVIVGEICRYGGERRSGALRGRRVLLTCSEALQEKALLSVVDFGGVAVRRPLIRLKPSSKGLECVRMVSRYDWLIITSPSAVRCMMELFASEGIDLRGVPRIMVSGTGTAAELRRFGFCADVVPPDDFGAESMVEMARAHIRGGSRVLRLRSDKAGANLAEALKQLDVEVDDCVLYENLPVHYNHQPFFDIVFFASASAVEVFMNLWSVESLKEKIVLAIGKPTALVLERWGRPADLISDEATVPGAIEFLARRLVLQDLLRERSQSDQPRPSPELCVGNA